MSEIHNPNKPTQSFRRRAVYTALADFLAEDQRMIMMCLWQTKYSEQPAYALNRFISDVCEFLNGECSRANINRKIVWALGLQPEQLDEDPIKKMAEYCKHYSHQLVTHEELLPQEVVFQHLFFEFIKGLNIFEYGAEEKIKKNIHDHLPKLELNGTLRSVESWLLQETPFISRMLNLQQMCNIIHLVYICGCEYCGPALTDKALTVAIKSTSTLPEAIIFPAEKFT
jgi:hypothetical protein